MANRAGPSQDGRGPKSSRNRTHLKTFWEFKDLINFHNLQLFAILFQIQQGVAHPMGAAVKLKLHFNQSTNLKISAYPAMLGVAKSSSWVRLSNESFCEVTRAVFLTWIIGIGPKIFFDSFRSCAFLRRRQWQVGDPCPVTEWE